MSGTDGKEWERLGCSPITSEMDTSLELLHKSVAELWDTSAPKIIKNYTDHGVTHCERLIRSASSILEANAGEPLSAYEAYLLLCGIYLHDIGMQCDVVRWPAIRERACELGAKFALEFGKHSTSDYSVKEQMAIRENHHILSAAWIEHEYTSTDADGTLMREAIKSIPKNMVEDVMDVCLYHTKKSITDCPEKCHDGKGRKRLVATIMRLADELDIASNRVKIGIVQTYSLSPENSVWWWLHWHTEINFISPFLICLRVSLHPDDFDRYAGAVQATIIEKFHQKTTY